MWVKFFILFILENGVVKLLSIYCVVEMLIVCEYICFVDQRYFYIKKKGRKRIGLDVL